MRIEKVVINASPLIVLFKSGQADLLPQLFPTIVIPDAVFQEVTLSKNDIAAQQLPTTQWFECLDISIHPAIVPWDLGAGESSVLSFALENPDYRAIVDDTAARRCANALGIETLGTGGAIVLAKQRGLIKSVLPRLQAARQAGLWLSDTVLEMLKQKAGE